MIWILKTDCKRCVSINQSSFISSCNITKTLAFSWLYIRRVWRYQRGNPYIEEEQTTQWTNAKHTHKTKDRVTRTPLKTGGELRWSGRVSSSGSTNGTRRVNLVTNPVISREWGKDWEVFATSWTYPWSFVTHIFHNGQPSHGGDCTIFEVMTIFHSKQNDILQEYLLFWHTMVRRRLLVMINVVQCTEL